MAGNLDTSAVSYGKTTEASFSPPEGSECLGFHSLDNVSGFTGLTLNVSGFNPIAGHKGGIFYAILKKQIPQYGGAPVVGFVDSPSAQGGSGYLLGLSEEAPSRIILRKGTLGSGMSISGTGVLRLSDESFLDATWVELALYLTVNLQGDIALRIRRRDPVIAGTWSAVPGMADIVDDIIGKASGSVPVEGDFFPVFGHYNSGQSGRVSLFDYMRVSRQLTP